MDEGTGVVWCNRTRTTTILCVYDIRILSASC